MYKKYGFIIALLIFHPAYADEFRSKNCPFVVSFPEQLGKITTGEPKSEDAAFGFLKSDYFSLDIACGDNIAHKPIPESAESEKKRILKYLNLENPHELLNFQFIRTETYALTFHSSLSKGKQEMIFLTVEGFSDHSLFTMVISVLPTAPDHLIDELQKVLKSVKFLMLYRP